MCTDRSDVEFFGILPVDYVIDKIRTTKSFVKGKNKWKLIDKDVIINSSVLKMKAIMKYGCECVECGAKPLYFALGRHKHIKQSDKRMCFIELYVERPDGMIDRMTADHVFPKSKGGSDSIYNLQPMCSTCNELKDDKIIIKEY